MSDIVLEIVNAPILDVEMPSGVVYVEGSGLLSYSTNQQLTLAQLRTARRNLIQGSAPVFAYDVNGRLSSITYSDASVKTFTYTNGLLTRLDHVYSSPARTYRKDFVYDLSNRLTSITESLL